MDIKKLLSATQTYYNLNNLENKLKKFNSALNLSNEKSQIHTLCDSILKEYDTFKVNELYPLTKSKIKIKDKKLNLLAVDNQIIHQDDIFEQLNKIDFLMNHVLIFSNAKKFYLMNEHLNVIHLLKDYLETPDIKNLFSKYHLEDSLIYSNLLLNHSFMFLKNADEPYNDQFMANNYEINLLKDSADIIKKSKKNLDSIKHDLALSFILYGYMEDKSYKDIYDHIKSIYDYKSYYSKIFSSRKNELTENAEIKELFQEKIVDKINHLSYFSSLNEHFQSYSNGFIQYFNNENKLSIKQNKAIEQIENKEKNMPTLLDRIRFIKDKKYNKTLDIHTKTNLELKEKNKTSNLIAPKLHIKYQ